MSRTKKSRACSHLPHLTSHRHTHAHTHTHTECGRENIVLWGMTGTLTPKEMLLPDASQFPPPQKLKCVFARTCTLHSCTHKDLFYAKQSSNFILCQECIDLILRHAAVTLQFTVHFSNLLQ